MHLRDFFLHVGNQFELGAGAIEVMPGTVNLKIFVPVNIIGEEPGAALKSHHLRPNRQQLDFQVGEPACHPGHETAGKRLEIDELPIIAKLDRPIIEYVLLDAERNNFHLLHWEEE